MQLKEHPQYMLKSTHTHFHDISTWDEIDISTLHGKDKKRFKRRRAAVKEYLTQDVSAEQVAAHYQFTVQMLLSFSEQCLWLHEDGKPWGFRALLPGATPTPSHVTIEAISTTEIGQETEPSASPEMQETPYFQETTEVLAEATLPCEALGSALPPEDVAPATVAEAALSSEGLESAVSSGDVVSVVVDAADEQGLTEAPVAEEAGSTDDGSIETALVHHTSATQEGAMVQEERALAPLVELRAVARGRRKRSTGGKRGEGVSRLVYQRRKVRKHWLQMTMSHKQLHLRYRVVSLVVVAAILLAAFVPIGVGLAAYNVYSSVRAIATDGIDHLLNAKAAIPISKSNPLEALDPQHLQQAQGEFRRAEVDFIQLQQLVERADVQSAVNQISPDYGDKLIMVDHLVQVALDVSRMGDEMSGVALIGAGIVHGSPLASGSTKPLISVADMQAIEGSLVHALYYISDIRMHMSHVQLKDLPISTKQQSELLGVLALLPKAQDTIVQVQGLTGTIAWLLGVGHARRFLVQTMDRGELRPGGGFTGQYGIFQVQDGRMAPFSLRDVALLDYAGNGVELGRSAPPQYSSWMNFGNWGLRDSNLSGDYPTTAQMNIQVFQDEGGGPVDGDIAFTPTFIGHILDVTGPIRVAEYNETITSKNLEERLHYYQQNYDAIALQRQKTNDNSHAVRKAFTSLVGKLLLDRMRHLSTQKLIQVVKNAVKDIQSRDLEIYFTDPTAEAWLVEHGYSGGMDTFSKQDGFMVVQANISISKASQFVHTTEHDDIVLDAQGGATHNLTITLNYQQTGPVYGFDTYADYVRVYAPANAQFLSGDGFDTGQCLPAPAGGTGCCTSSVTAPPVTPPGGKGSSPPPPPINNGCSVYKTSFPSDARTCPDGNYDLGDRNFQVPWKIDSLGSPTALTSDLPGRAMWGGLTETPKNCISTIKLSWYVPHIVKDTAGQSPYALLIQKQGGYVPTVQIMVDDSALAKKGLKPYQVQQDLLADKLFALPILKK